MNGKMKKTLSMLLVAIMIMGLIPLPVSASTTSTGMEMKDIGADTANALPSNLTDGAIWTDKSVTSAGNGEFDVTLRALGQDYKIAEPQLNDRLDVVFVLDISGSMGNKSKLSNMKTAAKAAVNTILSSAGNRVALVTYSDYATSYGSVFVTTSGAINTTIGALTANGGTNIQDAFFMAQKVIDVRTDNARKPVIILMSDGMPTYYYDSIQTTANSSLRKGTGSSNNTTGLHVWNTVKQAMYAKNNIANLRIYTIGFGVGSDAYAVATLMPTAANTSSYRSNETFNHTYWETGSSVTSTDAAQDISNAFVQIVNELIYYKPMSYTIDGSGNKVYSSVKLEDTIGTGYEVVQPLPAGVTIAGNKITWTLTPEIFKTMEPGNTSIDVSKLNTVTFKVKIKNDLNEGTYYTNNGASGYFEAAEKNPGYKNISNKNISQDLTHKGWLTLYAPPVKATLTLTKVVEGPVTNEDRIFNFALYSDQACTSLLTTSPIAISVNGAGSANSIIEISLPASYFNNNSATVYAKEITADSSDLYWTYDNDVAQELVINKGIKTGNATFTNVYAPKGTLTVEKKWVGAEATTSVAFKLKEKINGTWNDVGVPYTLSSPAWKTTIGNLDLDKEYSVEEVVVPQDYVATYNNEKVIFSGGNLEKNITITNTYKEPQGVIKIKKRWNDNSDSEGFRPASVMFEYTGPTSGSIVLSADNNGDWSTDFFTSEFGTYTFTEVVPQDYTATATQQAVTITKEAISDRTNSISFENSYVTPKGTMTVKKEWKNDENDTSFRPTSVLMKLFKKIAGTATTSETSVQIESDFELNEGNSWTKTFKELFFGEYSIEEIGVDDYTTSYSTLSAEISKGMLGDITSRTKGITVLNTFTNPKGEITVNKVWVESGMNPNDTSPSEIIVTLQGGEISKQVTLSAINGWTHTFKDLPLTKDGAVYRVSEAASNEADQAILDKYTQSITYGGNGGGEDGITINHNKRGGTATITNTYAKGTLTVTKNWVDKDNPKDEQPTLATISLYKDTMYIKVTDIMENTSDGAIKIGETTAEAIKTELIETSRILDRSTSPASLSTTFYDLELSDDSTYYVVEKSIPYYSTQYSSNGILIPNGIVINDDNQNGSITVRNTYDDPKGSLTVYKVWNHKNNPNKPTEVTVTLLKDGVNFKTQKFETGSYTFENLDLRSTYTISEKSVSNYQSSGYSNFSYTPIKGDTTVDHGNATITNTYIPEFGSLKIVKKWEGTTGGAVTATITRYDSSGVDKDFNPSYILNEGNNWQYEFTGLELYGPGGLYTYHVQETGDDLTLYNGTKTDPQTLEASKMATITITNKYMPNKGILTINKKWLGVDGETTTPATTSVSIVLIKNGVAEEPAMVLSEENGWTVTRSELDAGSGNVYSVKELNTFEDINISYSENVTFTPGSLSDSITVTNQKNEEDISLTVSKEATKETAFLTDGKATFDYVITITNTGNRTLTNLSIEDLITPTDGAIGAQILYNKDTDAFRNLGSLAPGKNMTFTYSVSVDKSGTYDNKATATGTYGDSETSDFDTASTLVKKPGLSIVKDVVGPSTITGNSGTFTYLLTIRNDGEVDLEDVTVQDVMGLVAGSTGNYVYSGANFDPETKTFIIGDMPSQSTDVAITYTVALDKAGTYTNTATVTGDYISDYNGEDETQMKTTIMDNDDATVNIVKRTTTPTNPTNPTNPTDPFVPIEEPEVPLGGLPDTTIPEEDVPLSDVPQTGGIPAMMLYGLFALMLGSGTLLRKMKIEK